MTTPSVPTMREARRSALRAALAASGGHRMTAARFLEISGKTIYDLCKREPDIASEFPAPVRARATGLSDLAQTTEPVSA